MPLDSTVPDINFSGRDLDPLRQSIALFRYGVIADITHLPPQHRGLYTLLRDKAEREHNTRPVE